VLSKVIVPSTEVAFIPPITSITSSETVIFDFLPADSSDDIFLRTSSQFCYIV
jgi:hypothetical protein